MHICLFGPTGSGKSTLAKALSDEVGVPVVSTGAIAREQAEHDPQTKLLLQQGEYAPEGAMRLRVKQLLEQADLGHGGCILDGFPRTMAQWILMTQWVAVEPLYIEIVLPLHTSLMRLHDRARNDDIADAIEAKLQSYNKDTVPVLDMLRAVTAVYAVKGDLDTPTQVRQLRPILT